MRRTISLFVLAILAQFLVAQTSLIKGKLMDDQGEEVSFANVVLYTAAENNMLKAEISDMDGRFILSDISPGEYYIEISFLGLEEKRIDLNPMESEIDLGMIELKTEGIQIETAVVTAKRALVEVKADKTVFNVEGTINSAGEDAIGLLRKAPGVLLDNNDNITVLGRTGVLLYVDGKKLPLAGEDLTAYLENIPSEQIDRFDIISSPGAKYEAEGNAGIIDIRLKKSKNVGTNGNVSASFAKGVHPKYNFNTALNHRREKFNIYGNLGYSDAVRYLKVENESIQNGYFFDSYSLTEVGRNGFDGKLGLDYYLNENSTLGFLYSSGNKASDGGNIEIRDISSLATRNIVDSVLVADNLRSGNNLYNTFNLNYAYQLKDKSLNIDFDFGKYNNDGEKVLPNYYLASNRTDTLSSYFSKYLTPALIDIYTMKVDYEQEALGGKIGIGAKFSLVKSDNTFDYSEQLNNVWVLNEYRSNNFVYDEKVYATYLSYSSKLTDKLQFSSGARLEWTDAVGELTAYVDELNEDPVLLPNFHVFPTVGLSYNLDKGNMVNLNYGRRLNRPDYNVLNPFREQRSELFYLKGNPFLKPEIVNNYEIGYTHAYRYNFKFSYSRTKDQITRLIGPDEDDPRASFLSYDNLATQDVLALNASLPFEFTSWWNAFINLSGSYKSNKANYDNGAVIDLDVWSYNIFTQQTFNLPYDFVFELSGRYHGPGIWGGVFRYEASGTMDVGVQRKFFNKNLNVKLAFSDLFHQDGWQGSSSFNGLDNYSIGRWDSQRLSLSVSYKFGNSKLKTRQRKTGLEEESKRVGESG